MKASDLGAALASLDVSGNPVSDLAPLADLNGLVRLDVSRTAVSDLSPLKGLTGLYDLSVGNNQSLTDLTPVAGLTGLARLSAREASIGSVFPLTITRSSSSVAKSTACAAVLLPTMIPTA